MICKLLERLIKHHMVDFLVRLKLLNPSQHGFLKVRSCLTNRNIFDQRLRKIFLVGTNIVPQFENDPYVRRQHTLVCVVLPSVTHWKRGLDQLLGHRTCRCLI